MLELGTRVTEEREQKKKQVEWMRARGMLNTQTGEICSGKDGETLTLEDISRSWYAENGPQNNVRMVSRRASRALKHPADVKLLRPKLVTLTFGDKMESWQVDGALSKFTNTLTHWAKRNGGVEPAYFWVNEVQAKNDRGAAHYHLLVLGIPYLPKQLLESWWKWGYSDIRAFDNIGRALSYLKKYMWKWADVKVDLDSIPDWWFYYSIFSKRRFGFSRWFSFSPAERIPLWLKEVVQSLPYKGELVSANRMVGGGWLVQVRGSPICDEPLELRMKSPYALKVLSA